MGAGRDSADLRQTQTVASYCRHADGGGEYNVRRFSVRQDGLGRLIRALGADDVRLPIFITSSYTLNRAGDDGDR